jgi:hypothetical protein
MSNQQKWIIGVLAAVLLLLACAGAACVGLGGLAWFQLQKVVQETPSAIQQPDSSTVIVPSITPRQTQTAPATDQPEPQASPSPTALPSPEATSTLTQAESDAWQTLSILEKVVVPINDPRDLAFRLEGKLNIPATMEAPKTPLKVGDNQTFWAANVNTNENFQVNTTLRYITPHVYFWIQDGVRFNQQALQRLCDTFENKIYPTDRAFFGSEWSPGIDNDVHLYMVMARGLGASIAGYFSPPDELPPMVHRYSNAHEMFFLNADGLSLSDQYTYSVMAHEFQHMIHWYRDRNEESWMNEGFAVLAEFLNGYDIGGFDALYVTNPDLQLTDWPSPPEATPHYGAAFLFLEYFLDRFGEKATQALVANTDNGLDSIDKVLASLSATDSQTGKIIQADDVFADWEVTSYLNDSTVGDGRFAYRGYHNAPRPDATEKISNCSPDQQDRTVHQYGADYIQISCAGNYTLHFQGSTEVGVIPVDAHSGKYAFWSNRGDESDMTLTHVFDFTQVSGPLTLQYAAWYDLEKDYDYAYLTASEDGKSWQILQTPSGRDKSADPSGNAYGWGYTGATNGWIEESVDLSQFAGKKVQIRFEYVTDAAVNNNGLLVDDIRIPQINYATDFEKDDGGWVGDGFVRIENRLPQTFRISLIRQGQSTSVEYITLDGSQSADIPLQFGTSLRDAVLVVSGVTRFTTQEASYSFRFDK